MMNPIQVRTMPQCLHQQLVIQASEGSHYTLPIISTFPKKSRLSVLAIRLRAGLSTFFGRHVEKVD
jgi:hypothetical protein